MKKLTVLYAFILLSIFLIACTTNEISVKNTEINSQKGTKDSNKSNIKEETLTKDYTFIQKVTYTGENSSTVLIKNKLTKTATIEETILFEESDLKNELFDMTNISTMMACGLFSMAFFNETALNEFKQAVEKWNSEQATIEDDSPPEKKDEEPTSNPLDGYKVTKVQVYLKDKTTKDKISECTITGYGQSNMDIKIY